MAIFKVYDLFVMSALDQTIVVGTVSEGTVSKGMIMTLNNKEWRIEGVEHVDGRLNDTWMAQIGLIIAGTDQNWITATNALIDEGLEVTVL